MKVEQIKTDSAPERVVKQFLQNLDTGEMAAGQKLPTQDMLSEMFGVGRSSIREAMNALAMMGYVEIIQGKGSYIKKELPATNVIESNALKFFETANLFNLLEIREVLECYAVEKAAIVASEDNIEKLRKAVNRLGKSGSDLSEFLLADLDFHVAIGMCARLPELADLVKGIHKSWNKKLPVIFSASQEEKIENSIQTAKQVLGHIKQGEGKQAARCMRNHLCTVNDDLRDDLAQKQFKEQ